MERARLCSEGANCVLLRETRGAARRTRLCTLEAGFDAPQKRAVPPVVWMRPHQVTNDQGSPLSLYGELTIHPSGE